AATDTGAARRYEARLGNVIAIAPTNLAVRLELADALLRRGMADSALVQLEQAGRIGPEMPKEVRPVFDTASRLLRTGQAAAARPVFDRFVRAVTLTSPYQTSLAEVKWL